MIEKICERCGKIYILRRKREAEKQRFCSVVCCWEKPKTKECKSCLKNLPLSEFYKNLGICKPCKMIENITKDSKTELQLKDRLENYAAKLERANYLKNNPHLKWCNFGEHFVSTSEISKGKPCKNCRKAIYATEAQKISVKGVIYRKENQNKIRKMRRASYIRNSDYYKNLAKQRKAKVKKAAGKYTAQQWKDKINYFGCRCYLCGKDLSNQIIHAEHRKPISRGGSNWIANIAPACADCNLSKHSKTEKEYRAQMCH